MKIDMKTPHPRVASGDEEKVTPAEKIAPTWTVDGQQWQGIRVFERAK